MRDSVNVTRYQKTGGMVLFIKIEGWVYRRVKENRKHDTGNMKKAKAVQRDLKV